jgi:hypothetical protein
MNLGIPALPERGGILVRLLHKNDDEMLKTIQLSVRTGARNQIITYFKDKAEKNSGDPDAWFYHGVCAWEMMNVTNNSHEKHRYLITVFNACERACSLQPDHWPGLFLRSLTRSLLMSNEYVDEMVSVMLFGYVTEDTDPDSLKMLDLQSQAAAPEPYFIVPYAILAQWLLQRQQLPEAERYISRGLLETSPGRVQYFESLLCIPLLTLFQKLVKLNQKKSARQLAERFNLLFPARQIKLVSK